MPKIFLIKNRLLQQQQRLLETSKQASPSSEGGLDRDDDGEKDSPPCHVTPRSLFGRFLANRSASPSPVGDCGASDHDDNDSDEPLSLVVHKGSLFRMNKYFFSYRNIQHKCIEEQPDSFLIYPNPFSRGGGGGAIRAINKQERKLNQ
ncbi:Protein ovo [Folsomia candida]|uniref:Protein ovo n=1 Tax=Folsomia candida TaxID=158441 RepID=A0A226E9G3_FOLCA|nr:Protein ovo [Folsomia candida]